MTQWCQRQRGDKSRGCGVEWRRVFVSTLSGVAALHYLSAACNHKWSQFDGSNHASLRDISYSSHNAVIDILEPAGCNADDSTLPISSKHSAMLTEFSPLWQRSQYLMSAVQNICKEPFIVLRVCTIVYFITLTCTALINNIHFIFITGRTWGHRAYSLCYFISGHVENSNLLNWMKLTATVTVKTCSGTVKEICIYMEIFFLIKISYILKDFKGLFNILWNSLFLEKS